MKYIYIILRMNTTEIKGILIAISAFFYQLMLGSFYVWGSISVYVTSYFKQYDDHITTRILTSFMPIRAIILLVLLPLGSILEKKYGPKVICAIGAGGMFIGVFSLSFIKDPYLFIALFSFGFGIPTLAFYVPLMCSWKYFPDKKGLLSGVSLCGFSLGPLFFSYIAHKIVNPDDIAPREVPNGKISDHYFDENVYNNVPKLFRILSIIWGIILLYVVLVIEDPPKEYTDKLNETKSPNTQQAAQPISPGCPDIITGLKHFSFWILLIMLTVSTWSDFIFGLAYKEIGFNYHYGDEYLTRVGVYYSLANCAGRLTWGMLYQSMYFKHLYVIVLSGQVFFAITLLMVASSPYFYPIWIMADTFCTCGNFVTFPPLCLKIFGNEKGGNICSFVCTGFSFGAIALYVMNLYVLPSIGYKSLLELVGMIGALGFILLYFLDLNPVWPKPEASFKNVELRESIEDIGRGEKEIKLLKE